MGLNGCCAGDESVVCEDTGIAGDGIQVRYWDFGKN